MKETGRIIRLVGGVNFGMSMGIYLKVIVICIIKGEWREDKANGYGVYIHVNGARYEGNWRDDLQDGNGVETWYYKYIYIYILLIGLMGLAMRGSTAKVRSMARGCMYGVMDPSTWAYGSTIRSVGMECIHG